MKIIKLPKFEVNDIVILDSNEVKTFVSFMETNDMLFCGHIPINQHFTYFSKNEICCADRIVLRYTEFYQSLKDKDGNIMWDDNNELIPCKNLPMLQELQVLNVIQ